MKLRVYNSEFTSYVTEDISEIPVLPAGVGEVALRQSIIAYCANMRQGNANTKDRGAVSGSGKKPYRQKGTGMARQGSKRSPIWSGGGVVFGPRQSDHYKKTNKKIASLATQRAFQDKIEDDELYIAEKLATNSVKTKDLCRAIRSSFGTTSVLFVDTDFDKNFHLAARNIPNVFSINANFVNALDIMRHKRVVCSKRALSAIIKRLINQ